MKARVELFILSTFICLAGACLFRNPTVFMYPLHASCNITWTFQQDCKTVRQKLVSQFETWKRNDTCGRGQTCLYSLTELKDNKILGTHITPKIQSTDDIHLWMYNSSGAGGCNVIGYSKSRAPFVLLDYGTNYCNLHNLIDGAGLTKDVIYSELTRDEICTQYTSAKCDQY